METTYDFAPFLGALRSNPLQADPVLRRWLEREGASEAARVETERYGNEVMGPLWDVADEVDRVDRLPLIEGFDAYRRRTNRVRLGPGVEKLWDATFGRGLGAPQRERGAEAARLAKVSLFGLLGELGTVCPLACTDGMVRVLERYPSKAGDAAVARVRANEPGRIAHGAQFVTEIQAGSDAAKITVDAVPQPDGTVTLHGAKWFCSNVTATYWVVLARFAGAQDKPVLALVEREPAQAGGRVTVDRLKDKLGTRALATAEVTLAGAPGHVIGEPGRGLAIVVGIVLTTSRVWTALGSASSAVFAARAAREYARFRAAFGRSIGELPMVGAEIERLGRSAAELQAGALATLARWGAVSDSGSTEARAVRLLVSLCKRRVTTRATQVVHDSMMVLGGNGIEERFTPLPRLLRDAVINETWEGPHMLLATQAWKDLAGWHKEGRAADVLDALLAGAPGATSLRDATLAQLGGPTPAWAAQCDALFDAYAAAELERL